jgi:2-polyprenyl-3-methyl-5-hydroxy-6-metoxy-1,4-benzoquinol methylase
MAVLRHICSKIKNSDSVVHIGALPRQVDEKVPRVKRHKAFKKAAPKIIGLDIQKDVVKKIQKMEYPEIHYGDITNKEDVDSFIERFGTFDHVVAPELIEHVRNAGLMFDNIYNLTNPKGNIYLTTPNAAWPDRKFRKLHPEHICYYDFWTLKVSLKMSKLEIKEVFSAKYYDGKDKYNRIDKGNLKNKSLYVIATRG